MHMPQPKIVLKKRGLRKRGLVLYGLFRCQTVRAAVPADKCVRWVTFEISDGNNLVKFGRRTSLPARKALEILG